MDHEDNQDIDQISRADLLVILESSQKWNLYQYSEMLTDVRVKRLVFVDNYRVILLTKKKQVNSIVCLVIYIERTLMEFSWPRIGIQKQTLLKICLNFEIFPRWFQ